MDKSTIVRVLNRDTGSVVYSIPEMNGLKRVFQSGEIKEVTFEEIQKLSYIPGGSELLRDSLLILDNDEAVKETIGHVEPEYNYTKEDVLKLMTQGSLDEFLDCLDFAPEGVKELVKTLAVELPLNDVSKRKAIKEKLGFDVDAAAQIQEEAADVEPAAPKARRRVVKTQTGEPLPSRRVVKK